MSGVAEVGVEVYRCTVRRARKTHKCYACGRKIHSGQKYSYTFVVSEGEQYKIKRCGACEITYRHLDKLCREHNESEHSTDWLVPELDLSCGLAYAEEWGGPPPEHIARLPFLTDDEAAQLLE